MAQEAEVDLVGMSPSDRAAWMRQQLVKLPGKIQEVDGDDWKVLEHTSSLPQLMVGLAGGRLSNSVCRDINTRMYASGWRMSDPMAGNSHQRIHRILILPEDGLIPESASTDDKPAATVADAAPAGAAEDRSDLDVEDLQTAARVMTWAAEQITSLRSEVDRLAEENRALRGRLTDLRSEFDLQQRGRPPVETVLLFRDGLDALSGLQQP